MTKEDEQLNMLYNNWDLKVKLDHVECRDWKFFETDVDEFLLIGELLSRVDTFLNRINNRMDDKMWLKK